MPIGLKRLSELCTVRFEKEYKAYSEYFGSVVSLAKDERLEQMFSKYSRNALGEEEVLECIRGCSPSSLKYFTKIYEYEEDLCKKKAVLVLKGRYMEEEGYERDAIFQCIRRLSHFLDFEFVKETCDDECLALVVGEYARKHELDGSFLDEVVSFLPSVFFGYTWVNNLLLDSFEASFERVVGRCLEVLLVVDCSNRRVTEAISRSPLKKKILEYLISNDLVGDGALGALIDAVGHVDAHVFLSDRVLAKLSEESIVRYLDSIKTEEVVEIGVLGCECRKLFKVMAQVIERRAKDFMEHSRIADVLLLIVYHRPETRLGDFLGLLKASPEREFLIAREEGERRIVVDVDRDTGEIREIGPCAESLAGSVVGEGEFRFAGGKRAGKKEVEEYLKEICLDERDFIGEVRRKLGFTCFLDSPEKPTFGQLVELPAYYFVEALRRYSNEFLGLVHQFNEIVIPTSRKRDLIAKRIVSSGYKELFTRYLIKRNRYFNMEVDIDLWFEEMTTEYKIKYLHDHPAALAGREDKIAAFPRRSIDVPSPVGERTGNRETPEETIYKTRRHASETSDFSRQDNRSLPCDRGEGDGAKQKKCSKLDGWKRRLDGTNGNAGERWGTEKKARMEDEAQEENVYDDCYPIDRIDYTLFRERVGFICNEVNRRICKGSGLDRAGKVTSVLARDEEMVDKILSILQGVNRFGKDLASFVEFFVFFLSYCRIEVGMSPTTVKTLKRYISEEGSDSVLYFVFMKARVEEIGTLLRDFKDCTFGVICKAVCDRIRAVRKSMMENAEDKCTVIKARVDQPVIRRKRGRETRIDVAEVWNCGGQVERINKLVASLLSSDDESMQYLGLEGLYALRAEVDVESFLDSRSDRVVEAALKTVVKKDITSSTNKRLMEILYRRGRLDSLGKMCLKAINIDVLEKDDVDRIYDMFFIDPESYLELLPRILDRGYKLSGDVAMELVRLLGQSQCDSVLENAIRVLRNVEYTEEMALESILALENARFAPKMFLVEKIYSTPHILSTRGFLKLCVCIGNEENYAVLKGLLQILRKSGVNTEIVEKWKKNRGLDRLMVRIYPLYMKDRSYYRGILDGIRNDRDEWSFISEFYKSEFEAAGGLATSSPG
ncbi:hypothetical protein J0A71_09g19640 [Encephalitozoon cuniculi]|nr:hypothetical protein J0A71_09g19640 [Encephalitozoon cuniculi]